MLSLGRRLPARFAVATTCVVALTLCNAASSGTPGGRRVPEVGSAYSPAWSKDGKWIAFAATKSRNASASLFLMRPDGSGLRRLTARGFDAGSPSWSPDGRSIAFDHREGPTSDVYAVDTTGGRPRLVASAAWSPAWGPGGRKVAFAEAAGDYGASIYVISPDATGRRNVADPRRDPEWDETYFDPAWSPDGERLAFGINPAPGEPAAFRYALGAIDSYGGKIKELTGGSIAEPDWSPDGHRIAFSIWVEKASATFIAFLDLRTRRIRYLREGFGPSWSPDGRRLAFARSTRAGKASVYVMNADGSSLRRLTG